MHEPIELALGMAASVVRANPPLLELAIGSGTIDFAPRRGSNSFWNEFPVMGVERPEPASPVKSAAR